MAQIITYTQGCRIKYRLHLGKITQETVAKHAGCSPTMVAQFLKGLKGSEKIKTALLKLLGYQDFDALVAPFHDGNEA
jgi:transcriptional regulator with XRE-family HTH domain